MTNFDERLEQLRSAFSAELDERPRTINQALLRLEDRTTDEQASAEAFATLFREAHSLKDAARAVELTYVERLAHAFESALEVARSRRSRPNQHWFATMFRVADAFPSLGVDASELDDLKAALESAGAQPAPESKSDQPRLPGPGARPPPPLRPHQLRVRTACALVSPSSMDSLLRLAS